MKDKEREGFAEELDGLRVLFDHAPVCIPEMDTDGRLLTVNRAGLDLVRAGGEDQVSGQGYLNHVSLQDKGRIRRLLTGAALWFGFWEVSKDRPRYNIARFMPTAVDGRGDRLIGSTTAIADRQQAETGLRRLNRSYALLSRYTSSLAKAADEPDLLHVFCRNLVDVGGYRCAWVGYASDEPSRFGHILEQRIPNPHNISQEARVLRRSHPSCIHESPGGSRE